MSVPDNNWDTFFAQSYTTVNQVIAYDWPTTDEAAKHVTATKVDQMFGTISLDAKLGPWELAEGGDGRNVRFKLTYVSGTMKYVDIPTIPATDMTGVTTLVEVNMEYVPDPLKGETTSNLVTSSTVQAGDSKKNAATVMSGETVYPTPPPPAQPIDGDSMTALTGDSLLSTWMNSNGGLEAFQFVFHQIDVSEEIDKDPNWKFIKPTSQGYSCVATMDPDTSVFGIMTMIGNHARPSNNTIAVNAIPDKCNAGFNIAGPIFVTDMLLTGAAAQFKQPDYVVKAKPEDKDAMFNKWVAETFTAASDDGMSVTNVVDCVYGDFIDDNGTKRRLTIAKGKFKIGVAETFVTTSFDDLQYEYSPGINVHINFNETFNVGLQDAVDPKTKEKKKVFSLTSHTRTCNTNITKSKAVVIEELVTTIALSVTGAVLGGMLGAVGEAAFIGEAAADSADAAITVETDALVTTSMDIASDTGTDAITMTADSATLAGEEFADNAATKMSGFLARNAPKVAGALLKTFTMGLGAGLGGAIARMPDYIMLAANSDFDNCESFTVFSDNAMAAHTWPGAKGYDLVSLGLHHSLQIGLDISVNGDGKEEQVKVR